MQAIVRRATRIQAQLKRNDVGQKKAAEHFERLDRQEDRNQSRSRQKRTVRKYFRNSLEDWRLGSLAPKRNSGHLTLGYGAVDRRAMLPAKTAVQVDLEDQLSYDEHKYRNFYRPDDKVVILRGPERGMIGKVQSVDEESMTLKLSDLNKVYFTLGELETKWMADMNVPPEGQLQPRSLSQADVRLIMTTPSKQDVIVDKMLLIKERHESGNDIIRRFVPGTMQDIDADKDIEPVEDPEDKNRLPDYEMFDTFQEHVVANSWIPTISLHEPFPASVIDELRSKYSTSRMRHDDAFVEKMMAMDEKNDLKRKAGLLMLRTPSKEFAIQQRAMAQSVARQQKLSEDSISLIAKHMKRTLNISQRMTPIDSPNQKTSMTQDQLLSP